MMTFTRRAWPRSFLRIGSGWRLPTVLSAGKGTATLQQDQPNVPDTLRLPVPAQDQLAGYRETLLRQQPGTQATGFVRCAMHIATLTMCIVTPAMPIATSAMCIVRPTVRIATSAKRIATKAIRFATCTMSIATSATGNVRCTTAFARCAIGFAARVMAVDTPATGNDGCATASAEAVWGWGSGATA